MAAERNNVGQLSALLGNSQRKDFMNEGDRDLVRPGPSHAAPVGFSPRPIPAAAGSDRIRCHAGLRLAHHDGFAGQYHRATHRGFEGPPHGRESADRCGLRH